MEFTVHVHDTDLVVLHVGSSGMCSLRVCVVKVVHEGVPWGEACRRCGEAGSGRGGAPLGGPPSLAASADALGESFWS